jgi:hypothetical protein
MAASLEILCTACGQVALARAEPVYDGLRKSGEVFVCTACRHQYPNRAATPFVAAGSSPRVFTDADKSETPQVFDEAERRRSCAWCRHFVINPFAQRCGLTNRATEATDLCARFEPREAGNTVASPPSPRPNSALDRLFGDGPDRGSVS